MLFKNYHMSIKVKRKEKEKLSFWY